jgi:hypothetical protein
MRSGDAGKGRKARMTTSSRSPGTRRAVLAGVALSTCALGAFGLVACSSDTKVEPGELIVGVDTNVALPGKADGFVLTITRAGVVVFGSTLAVGEPLPKVLLPATVGVVNGTDSPDPVTVRMMATENGQVVGLREAVLTVPTNRVALLQLTVDGLCLGDASVTSTVSASAATSGTVPANACADGLTCILGGCQSNEVDAAGLPDFVATGAFGTSDGGTCFDSELCFHDLATARYRGYEVLSRGDAGCTVPLPPGANEGQINIGIPADPSACAYDASPCVIPLVSQPADQAPQVGFHFAGDQIVLPPGLCTQTPAVTEVLVATAYLSASSDTPLCGSWSRVTTVTPDPDPVGVAIPDASAGDATLPPQLDGGADAQPADAADDGDAAYVWGPAADAGAPVAITMALSGAQPNLVPGTADTVIAWNGGGVQVSHAAADSGAAVTLYSGANVGGVAADLGSVYIAESGSDAGASTVVRQCSYTSCTEPVAPTISTGTTQAATALTEGHGLLYGVFGARIYSCALGGGSCTQMLAGSGDVPGPQLLAAGSEGVYFAGIGPNTLPSAYFVPDDGTNLQRRFLLDSAAGGAIGQLASAGATDQSLFFNLVTDAGTSLERLDYAGGVAALTPTVQPISRNAAHVAANSLGVAYADDGGIYACTLDQSACTDAVSHPLVSASGITGLAMGDSYVFWTVGTSVYSLPLPTPLRAAP